MALPALTLEMEFLGRLLLMLGQADPAAEFEAIQRVRRALFGDIIDSIRSDATNHWNETTDQIHE